MPRAGFWSDSGFVRRAVSMEGSASLTRRFLRAIWPYLKQVSGLLILGSLGGIVMNTAVVLPAILLGRAIDTATAWAEGQGEGAAVLWAGLAYAGGMALYQGATAGQTLGSARGQPTHHGQRPRRRPARRAGLAHRAAVSHPHRRPDGAHHRRRGGDGARREGTHHRDVGHAALFPLADRRHAGLSTPA